jgi:hypothetical protein
MNAETALRETQDATLQPIVIDFGKHSRKSIKRVRQRGGGKLMDKIEDAVSQLREEGTMKATVQPVIVVVQQRRRSRAGLPGLLR